MKMEWMHNLIERVDRFIKKHPKPQNMKRRLLGTAVVGAFSGILILGTLSYNHVTRTMVEKTNELVMGHDYVEWIRAQIGTATEKSVEQYFTTERGAGLLEASGEDGSLPEKTLAEYVNQNDIAGISSMILAEMDKRYEETGEAFSPGQKDQLERILESELNSSVEGAMTSLIQENIEHLTEETYRYVAQYVTNNMNEALDRVEKNETVFGAAINQLTADLDKAQAGFSSEMTRTWNELDSKMDREISDTKSGMEKQLSGVKSELGGSIADTKTEMKEELSGAKTEWNSKLTGTKEELTNSLTRAKTELDQTIGAAKTDFDNGIQSAKTEFSENLAAAKTEFSTNLGDAKARLDRDLTAAKSELSDNMTAMKTELSRGVNENLRAISGLTNNLSDSIDRIDALDERITSAEEDRGGIHDTIDGIQTDLDAANARIGEVQTALDGANTRIGELQGNHEAMQGVVQSAQESISNAETRITALEEKTQIQVISRADYESLAEPDPNTLYFITG